MAQEVIDFQWNRIVEAVKLAGFTGAFSRINRKTCNGVVVPFLIDMDLNEHDNITLQSKVTLYATDAYPVTAKDEAVLHVWDMMGSSNKGLCGRVAAQLNRAGISARVTTYKKNYVVAFDAGDWLSAT